ncbi:hypothetical protein ACWGH4_20010 [Streptomyces sp. NPDC054847]
MTWSVRMPTWSDEQHFPALGLFLPCDLDPDWWKVVTMVHEEGCETFDGPFSALALAGAPAPYVTDCCETIERVAA